MYAKLSAEDNTCCARQHRKFFRDSRCPERNHPVFFIGTCIKIKDANAVYMVTVSLSHMPIQLQFGLNGLCAHSIQSQHSAELTTLTSSGVGNKDGSISRRVCSYIAARTMNIKSSLTTCSHLNMYSFEDHRDVELKIDCVVLSHLLSTNNITYLSNNIIAPHRLCNNQSLLDSINKQLLPNILSIVVQIMCDTPVRPVH